MRHLVVALLLAFNCASLDAALPLAWLGKEIVKSIVRSLIEDALHATLRATLGPCDGALASTALANAQALIGGRGVAPGLAAGAFGAMGASAFPGGPPVDLSGLGLTGRIEDLPPPMREAIEQQRAEALRELRADQKRRGLTPEQTEAEDRRLAQEQLQLARDVMAMLRDAKPLTTAELDEFVAHYGKLATLAPAEAACSPQSLRRLLAPALAMPMAAGPIRMMLSSLRELDRSLAESRRTFAAMTPDDRAEFVRQMTEQIDDWSEADRQGFAQLLRADVFGMPVELR